MLAVINQIDIPRLQVQVDAIIVELSEEQTAALGVTWLRADDEFVGLTNFSNAAAAASSGWPARPRATRRTSSAIAEGITIGVGKLTGSGGWAALINALRGDAGTNIVSTPQIVTLDNEEAEIRVGQEVPFVTGQFTNTGANQGSVNPFQTIQREEVGTSLKITPQINEGSGVRLEIEQETSSLGAAVEGAADLITNTRTITTSVFVNDGDVLILGGLIDEQLRESDRRVPGLGRIPGLGWLFRSRTTDRAKDESHGLHPPDDPARRRGRALPDQREVPLHPGSPAADGRRPRPPPARVERPLLPPLPEEQAETVVPNAAPPDGSEPPAAEPDGSEPQ